MDVILALWYSEVAASRRRIINAHSLEKLEAQAWFLTKAYPLNKAPTIPAIKMDLGQ